MLPRKDRAILAAMTGSRKLLDLATLTEIREAQQALAESGQDEIDEITRRAIREREAQAAINGAASRQARTWAQEDYVDSLPTQVYCVGSSPMSYAPTFDPSDAPEVYAMYAATDLHPHVFDARRMSEEEHKGALVIEDGVLYALIPKFGGCKAPYLQRERLSPKKRHRAGKAHRKTK